MSLARRDEIISYIASDNLDAALEVDAEIEKRVDGLVQFAKTYTIMFADFVFDASKHWLRRAKWCDKYTDLEIPDSNV